MKRVTGLLPLLLTAWSCGDEPDIYSISLPNLKMDPDASVTSLAFDIHAGTVQAVQNIPIGWVMNITDEPGWAAQVKGNATTLAASLSAEELQRLVLIVRRNETGNLKFDISGSVTTSKSFEHSKRIDVSQKDFNLASGQ